MAAFQGVYTALITPMTAQDKLNEAALRKLIEANIESGADGFWVAGGGGESVLLDDDENTRIAQITVDQAKGRAKTIMHVGAPTTRRAATMAENAARAGVEAICCVPPFFYGQSHEAVAEHYRAVAAAAGLPFFAYNLPSATNCEITPKLMALIQERVPQLEGLKHSAFDFRNIREFARMGLSCFTGFSALMLPAMSMGAVGCVDGFPVIAPEPWAELRDAFAEGDMARALAAQDTGIEITKLLQFGHYHSVLKAAVSLRLGVDCGAPRPPGMPLSDAQHKALRKRMAELDLL